jgi:flagellar protein FlaG
VNTETVQPLSAIPATMPTSRATGSSAAQRSPSPVSVQALNSNAAPSAPATRTAQETLAAVAVQIESYLRSVGREVQFRIDDESGRTVVSIRDANTGEVIRQMPSEEALRLARDFGSPQSSFLNLTV